MARLGREVGDFAFWVPDGEGRGFGEVLAATLGRRYFDEDARAMRVGAGIDS